jgi:uncharacterized protein (DUF1810 family)
VNACPGFGKVVSAMGEIIGSARVHRWTSPLPTPSHSPMDYKVLARSFGASAREWHDLDPVRPLGIRMTDPDLVRFVEVQDSVRRQVVEELTAGHKQTHWMWFVFPQLAGLGHSAMSERYAIRDLDQAKRYLADPVLGDRLRHDVRLMLRHAGKSAFQILGSPDDLKFRSCVTLFAHAASNDEDRSLFKEALDQFYEGKSDPRTEQLLRR